MASHSPQRARRPQAQPANQGSIQLREASPSPTLRDQRPRAVKTQSMPLVPAFPQPPPQAGQNPQSSPGLPSNGARRTPPISSVPVRLLPTPPHNNPPTFEGERRLTPPPGPQQTMSAPNVNQLYNRPAPRGVSQPYPSRLQDFEDNWQMTEVLAEIDRNDQQQAHYQSSLPLAYPSAPQSESPPATKGPNVERVRATAERSSPINADNAQQRGRQQIPRESPKTRDRHPTSPIGGTYDPSLSPERRLSPAQVIETQSLPPSYTNHYNSREPAPVLRRAPASEQRLNGQVSNQSSQPPAIAARNHDRSLPVQEEDENGGHRSEWQDNDTMVDSGFSSSSPTPSSDVNPDGNSQRFDNSSQTSVHDEDENEKQIQEDRSQYNNRDSTEEDSGTPKSPTVALPRDNNETYYPGSNMPIRVPAQPVPLRPNGRNGPTDHIMRGLESTLMDNKQPQPLQPSSVPNSQPQQQAQAGQKFIDPRHQYATHPQQYPKYPIPQEYAYPHDLPRDRNGRYLPPQPQVYPDDFHGYDDTTSSYIASYLPSPRPDAPVPPTPQTQTAAPSPSPLDYNGIGAPKPTGTPGYRPPVRAAGSPYPFPFNHVRRNRQNQNSRLIANGLDPATITEQIARQWQVFAQNNQGNITDSTLSPSTTPFQADLFDHWAYLHTNRMMRGMHDTASMHSSPSHQPVPLPTAPPYFGGRKKGLSAKRQAYTRKPPPRVESTQPRDTSPEISSGEETAGDERANHNATPDIVPSVTPTDVDAPSVTEIPIENMVVEDTSGDGEWVDEEDEDDYDDLIDLEYHPSFVKNVSKRRRKWEVGWENLIQAFQALDRQTDATMILLASPSHTTKLHALQSRSIRRTPLLYNSGNMKDIRASFARISTQRRKARPERSSLVDRLASVSGTSTGDGSDGSSQASVEENLRRALDAALGSLGALGEVYEQREVRVLEELQRSREDRERVELLLRQVLGEKNPLSSPVALFGA